MEIKSVETKYIIESAFAGLIENEEFVPHYQTTIRYTDPRDGERAEKIYSAHGEGETEFASEQAALDNLKADMAAKVYGAIEKYNAAHGTGNLDIA